MIKKTITYTDYNGNERTEDHYFDLSKAELMEMQLSINGGFDALLQQIIDAKDVPTLAKLFKDLILKSYGKKHVDGIQFEKSEEISRVFSQTGAYSELYMELMTDSKKAAEFVNGIIPQGLVEQLSKVQTADK
jgi:hypothetical protein